MPPPVTEVLAGAGAAGVADRVRAAIAAAMVGFAAAAGGDVVDAGEAGAAAATALRPGVVADGDAAPLG